MELCDSHLWVNRDWDPVYLSSIFDADFNDYSDLWDNNISDLELITSVERMETYCPIVEDISMEDSELCLAVEQIETE